MWKILVAGVATVAAQKCYDITDGKYELADCYCDESCATCAWSEIPDMFDCISCFRNFDFMAQFPDGRGECIHNGSGEWGDELQDAQDYQINNA